MSNNYITDEDFRDYLQKIIEMIRYDSSKEVIINYVEQLMNEHSEGVDKTARGQSL